METKQIPKLKQGESFIFYYKVQEVTNGSSHEFRIYSKLKTKERKYRWYFTSSDKSIYNGATIDLGEYDGIIHSFFESDKYALVHYIGNDWNFTEERKIDE